VTKIEHKYTLSSICALCSVESYFLFIETRVTRDCMHCQAFAHFAPSSFLYGDLFQAYVLTSSTASIRLNDLFFVKFIKTFQSDKIGGIESCIKPCFVELCRVNTAALQERQASFIGGKMKPCISKP
jgi:hypothetical protein